MRRKQIPSRYRNLKDWRAAMGFTQQDCARLLGISQGLYSKWETGIRHPRAPKAVLVSRKTGVPILDLLGVAA